MKLTIERDALLTVLQRVATAASKRGAPPILNNVLLEATKNSELIAFATDLDIEARATGAAQVAKPGKMTLPAAALLDIAKTSPQGSQISIELHATRAHVSSGKAQWKLPVLPPADFPMARAEEWEWSAEVNAETLADLINRTSWAASTETIKAQINGVHVHVKDGRLVLVATDRGNVALADMATEGADYLPGLTIPLRTCGEIVRFCADRESVMLRFSYHKVAVESDDASLVSKIITLPFVEYERVVEFDRPGSFTANRAELATAIRRAMIGANTTISGHALRLVLSSGAASVAGRSAYSEASDDIEIEYDGPETKLGISGPATVEILGAVGGERVTVRFRDVDLCVAGEGPVTCYSALLKA